MLKTSIRIRFITGILLASFRGQESYGNTVFFLGSFIGVLSLLNMGSSPALFTCISQKIRSRYFCFFMNWDSANGNSHNH